MTMPKKGLRKIVIDNKAYCYTVKGKEKDFVKVLIQEDSEKPGAILEYYSEDFRAIEPSFVADIIRRGIVQGWKSDVVGAKFKVDMK